MPVEMKIKGLMIDPVSNMPIIILRDEDEKRSLPIWVGIFEANAIALELEKITTPRPMTHDLIKNIRNTSGCGILLISHDLHVVMAETDTVICLNGHVCCRGTPETVSQSPEYLRLFGARAGQTLAFYNHDHDHTHLPDGRVQHADGSITDDCRPDDGHHVEILPTGGKAGPMRIVHTHGPNCGCGHDHTPQPVENKGERRDA